MEKSKRNNADNCEAKNRTRKKKSRKELDLLRRNVLEAKKILRDETAPPKAHSSTFTKVLNKFADRRQANDNKNQGFDSAGKRTGKKKMCNRLLPSRKPQVGIFANGSKGAEIKRANLALTESDRARFEGDLQKILNDGKVKSKKSNRGLANKLPPKLSADTVDTNESDSPENQAEDNVSEIKPAPVVADEKHKKHNGKKRLQIPVAQDENPRKKHHAETDSAKIIAVQLPFGSDCERKNVAEKKWKRSLFQDEDEDSDPIRAPGVEDLRFSPTVVKTEVKQEAVQPKARPGNQTLNFNCGRLGRMAAAKYQELCTIVSAQNFDNFLKQMPNEDPLKKVRKSLINFCSDFQRQKELIRKHPTEFRANIEQNKFLYHKTRLEETEQPSTSNLKSSFNHQIAKTEASMIADDLENVTTEVTRVGQPNDSVSSESSVITEWETSSLRVNYGSPRASLKSGITECSRNDDTSREKILQKFPKEFKKLSKKSIGEKSTTKKLVEERGKFVNERERQLIRVPSIGEKMMLRYLQEASNPDSPPPRKAEDEVPSIFPPEVRPRCFQTASGAPNSLAVNCPDTLKDFDRCAGSSTMNLGSSSSSTLAQIPSAREKLMLRYLREVNNQDRSIPFSEKLAENQERRFIGSKSSDDFRRSKEPICNSMGSSPRTKKKAVLRYLQDVKIQNEHSAFLEASDLNTEKHSLGEAAKRPKLKFQKPVKIDEAVDSLAVNYESGGNSQSAMQNLSLRLPRVPSIRETILLRYLQDVQSGNLEEPEVGTAPNIQGKSERHMPAILRKSQQEKVWKKPRLEAEIGKNFNGRTAIRDEPEVVPTPVVVKALFELNERRSRANLDFPGPEVRRTIPRFVYPVKHSQANGISGQDQDCQRFPVFLKRRSSTSTGNSDELLHIAPRNEPRQVRQFQHSRMVQLPRGGIRNISTSLTRPTDIELPDSGVTFHQAAPPEVLQMPLRSYSEECFERRIDFVLPIDETKPIFRNAIANPPCRSDAPENLSRPQNFSPVLTDLRNYNCQCLVDPGFQQAGFLRSQIGENGGQNYQRVIQPIYNATDAYRPLQIQLLQNYYPADI
ncbi:uncharacterized protein LOC124404084 isoform X2 [Diprion similis]|uniref:uncharacterized protein LOC124404084 isoform X2 n=1 Tax=Diprion similis TaxID=362088 RepID=UPI001EF834C1|nr:uncharacterized protein LOC124404084 isoform X2 [Diprion similis]